MSNRFFADYHGYRLWVEPLGGREWRIWAVGPPAKEAGREPGRAIRFEIADKRSHLSETAAKDYATAWARVVLLNYPDTADEPVWRQEWDGDNLANSASGTTGS